MVVEDDTYVLHGPEPYEPLPKDCLGKMVLDELIKNPTDEVLVCAHTQQTISYKKIIQETCNLAEALRRYGCNEDFFIAISSENHLKYFIPVLATLCVGSVNVPINPVYSIEELKHLMNLTQPKIVFCSQFTVKTFIENRKEFSFVEKIILIDPLKLDIPGVEIMEDFIINQIGGDVVNPKTFKPFNGDPKEHAAFILTSSGTTGLPKGVIITDQNMQIRILQSRLKNIESIRQGYGLTECSAAILGQFNIKDKEGAAGTVATFCSVKIRDPETGASLGPKQVGEICIKSPIVMKGYLKNPEATKETFTSDGWLKTGDLGYYDEDGCFFIVDRLKELIKYKGYQVAPAELEAVLLNHPKVLDAGVVGLPDELAGELPVAFVAKQPGVDLTEKEIQDYIAAKVSPQKRLRGGVIFIPMVPKNPSGKILRKELRKMLADHKVQQPSKL